MPTGIRGERSQTGPEVNVLLRRSGRQLDLEIGPTPQFYKPENRNRTEHPAQYEKNCSTSFKRLANADPQRDVNRNRKRRTQMLKLMSHPTRFAMTFGMANMLDAAHEHSHRRQRNADKRGWVRRTHVRISGTEWVFETVVERHHHQRQKAWPGWRRSSTMGRPGMPLLVGRARPAHQYRSLPELAERSETGTHAVISRPAMKKSLGCSIARAGRTDGYKPARRSRKQYDDIGLRISEQVASRRTLQSWASSSFPLAARNTR